MRVLHFVIFWLKSVLSVRQAHRGQLLQDWLTLKIAVVSVVILIDTFMNKSASLFLCVFYVFVELIFTTMYVNFLSGRGESSQGTLLMLW